MLISNKIHYFRNFILQMNKDHRYQISTDCQVWRVEITRFNSLVQEAGRYAIPRKLSFSVIINEG